MQRTSVRRRLVWALFAVLALTGLLAACSDDDGDSDSGSATEDSTGGGSSADPETITIGYQAIPNGDLIVKSEGYLEEAFPDTEIEWTLFDSGGSVNEAIVAGSIDIGLAGSSPVSRGLSSGIEYQVPWIHDVIGEAESLVVNPDSGASSVEDLAGLTIATPFASTAHFSLLAALDAAGVDDTDVDIIDAEPDDIYAAYTRGDIDGAYVWNPNLASIIGDGGEVLITSAELAEDGDTTYDLGVVSNEFAEEFPDAVQTWVDAQDEAVRLIQDDPDAAAEAIAGELNLEPEDVIPQLEGLIFLNAGEQATPEFLGGGLAENLLAAAEFNLEQGEIEEVAPADAYDGAVKDSFAAAVG
jgi:taurine transport system substrate-binding protein